MLQRDREGDPATDDTTLPAGEPVEPVLSHPCEACGAGMRADQDWCLECGTAAPGRLGARPGWRAAFTVVGLTTLLLTGAVAASYAALTGDAQREASRPSAGDGQPIIAQTPGVGQAATPVTPGATGPGTTAPKPPAFSPPPASSSTPSSSLGATNTPLGSTGGSSSSTAGSNSGSTSGSSSTSSSTSGPPEIELAADAATTYDPAKRAGAEFGPAKNAVDDSKRSVWDVTVPVDNAPIGAGLVIDLGDRYTLESLTIDTPIPGFDVELYGANSTKLPKDILDERWEQLTDRNNYADGTSIKLKGRAKGKVRYINLWFTNARNAEDPRIAIANVTVTGTK